MTSSTQVPLRFAAEREVLEQKYSPFMQERLDFGRYVTYVANKNEPVFGWFRYKEGFSRYLVEKVIVEEWQLPADALIFDPFAGCGTTLLACQRMGYPGLGVDTMALAVFITKVKLRTDYDLVQLEQAARELLATPFRSTGRAFPKVRIIDLAFTKEAQERILFYRECIQAIGELPVRDFLMLALLCSLEEASSTSKDGQFLRLVKRPPKPVEQVLERKLGRMLADIRSERALGLTPPHFGECLMLCGDARDLPEEALNFAEQAAAIVTSPPYLNRYDYSRTYALELCLLYNESGEPCVKDFEDLKNIRHSLLRSHIESRPAPTNEVRLPALTELVSNLEPKELNNPRIPIMIKGYFEDMNRVIGQMATMLQPGGRVALVVANARFQGELVPVDLMLSELAAAHGLETERIWITRYKGNSSQQMGRYGRVPVRESILFWKKPDGGS